jgi:hypothetical protein
MSQQHLKNLFGIVKLLIKERFDLSVDVTSPVLEWPNNRASWGLQFAKFGNEVNDECVNGIFRFIAPLLFGFKWVNICCEKNKTM